MNIKLSTMERAEIYRYSLREFEKINKRKHLQGRGLCWFVRDAMAAVLGLYNEHERDSISPYREGVEFDAFPEIKKHMPPNVTAGDYWFQSTEDGNNKRIEILKEAIKETTHNNTKK